MRRSPPSSRWKVILAGIPDKEETSFSASIARRKGLTIKLVRRMKHTYPRAIELVDKGTGGCAFACNASLSS